MAYSVVFCTCIPKFGKFSFMVFQAELYFWQTDLNEVFIAHNFFTIFLAGQYKPSVQYAGLQTNLWYLRFYHVLISWLVINVFFAFPIM